MNDQSQIEAKIIHLTPPQRFQVAHQLPKDHPAEQSPIGPTPKSEEFKVVTTNPSKIWAIRILNGTWLLVTLFLKRCTRIDKNLLVVYVALVLLLLQVFMVISRAEAGSLNSPPLITSSSNLSADWQHTRNAQTFDHHYSRNAPPAVQVIERSSFTLPKNPPWQLRLAPTCPGTNIKAAGPESFRERFGSFSAAGNLPQGSLHSTKKQIKTDAKRLGHAPAMRGSIKSQRFQEPFALGQIANAPTLTQTRNRQYTSYAQAIDRTPFTLAKNPPWQLRLADTCPGTHVKAAGAAAAFLCLLSFRCRKESETRGSENENHPLSGSGVPQMITSFGTLT